MGIRFFESIFQQFPHESLVSGLSVYRAGGVQRFETFGELAQARVREGLGEYFDVHLKFHADGRGIQWFDCGCKENRRRGLKCAHLAAVCIFVDQDRPRFLEEHKLTAGASDDLVLGRWEGNHESGPNRQPVRAGVSGMPAHSAANEPREGSVREPLAFLQGGDHDLLKVAHAAGELGVLIATVQRSTKQEVKYRLGVDDSLSVLTWPGSVSSLSDRLAREWQAGLSCRRSFRISRLRNGNFVASRQASFYAGERKVDRVPWERIPKAHRGRLGVFVRKHGFVPFDDRWTSERESRWQDYPDSAHLDPDVVAGLFESDFARLRETAEIELESGLEDLRVVTGVAISGLTVFEDGADGLLIEPALTERSDQRHADAHGQARSIGPAREEAEGSPAKNSDESRVPITVSLSDVVRARLLGRSYLQTPEGWVRIGDEFDWVADKIEANGRIRLSKLEFIKFSGTTAAGSGVTGVGTVAKRLCEGLLGQSEVESPPLDGTRLSLRPYQLEGYRWLWWLYENRLGGLLADEMGLGKTHQAMALLYALSRKPGGTSPSLVVCPTSVIDHWLDKLAAFVPECVVHSYYGSSRRLLNRLGAESVVVTSYGILLRDIDLISARKWSVVILDEAHLVKNQATRTYRAACNIPSEMRLCLTGTPLENDLSELKALFDYIVPGYLGPDAAFRKKYLSAGADQQPLQAIELRRLLHPFKMRRTKADVLSDLPAKVEDVRHCQLTQAQKELYDQALRLKGQEVIQALAGGNGPVPYVHIFAVITLLKQICNDPGLVHPEYEGLVSGKLELLDELLSEALESQQKVVIFSQYAKMVDRLSVRLQSKGIQHVVLTGQSQNRGRIVQEFQTNPQTKVFIGSLLAGGTGIDLTAASVVIHFDRWWNAAKENQATDRIHRIGQEKNVQVFKLVTRGTLEEHIDSIIERKRRTFEKFVEEDAESFRHLSREDLLMLLSPAQSFQEEDGAGEPPSAAGPDLHPG